MNESNNQACTCQARIKAAINTEPSDGHDYVDEIIGLLRVTRGQRDDAERRSLTSAGGRIPAMSETGGTKVVGFQRGVMPPIVCLCGSTRFVETFNDWRKRLTHEGKIVLSIEIVTSQARHEDPQHTNGELKVMLDELHLRKIDLATEVMVLNVGGYIGESTRREIEYATATGKPIRWLENPEA